MKTLTVKQLKAALAKHTKFLNGTKGGERADFVGVDLRDHAEILRSANLYGADLRSANLYGANLRSADLGSANLRSADLYGANLYGANLRSANLYGANLRSADLRSADLGSADLRSADLYGADLRSADLRSADLRSADLGSKTDLGRKLRLVGACMDAVAWVDEQKHDDVQKIFAECPRQDWQNWIESALGGAFTLQRLDIIVDYVTKGIA